MKNTPDKGQGVTRLLSTNTDASPAPQMVRRDENLANPIFPLPSLSELGKLRLPISVPVRRRGKLSHAIALLNLHTSGVFHHREPLTPFVHNGRHSSNSVGCLRSHLFLFLFSRCSFALHRVANTRQDFSEPPSKA
jgi:hypothetical protein